jgi:UDP-N-acetylmuramate dehydrogenase
VTGSLAVALERALGSGRVGRNVPLAPMTTFRVGGPAEWLIEPRGSAEVLDALRIAQRFDVPVTMIGGGSNVLVADTGIRGLVIRPRGGAIERSSDRSVRADAAVTINGLVRWTINHGCAGLEAWAGTPGTVGGAVFGNAHFRGRLIGDLVVEARLASLDGRVFDVPRSAMDFGYDRSRLRTGGEILLSALFAVSPGEPSALRAIARESLAFRKRTQPLDTPSAGCIFRNPDPAIDPVPDAVPASAGALVDRAGLKGLRVGGARVSPVHGNFIVNEGSATARDIRRLIERCRDAVRAKFGVVLHEEIVYLGEFDDVHTGD